MRTVTDVLQTINKKIKKEWKIAFFTAVILGLLIHMPVFSGDFPNHDGLDSIYFDQNMITSGRWFLTVACGISSYYSLPWITGVLSLLYLGIGCAALNEFLHVKEPVTVALTSAFAVSFPALAATYGYLFTADGYLMAWMMVMLALAITDRFDKGFIPGAVLLSFAVGIYQSYLAFAAILALTGMLRILTAGDDAGYGDTFGKRGKRALHFVYLGAIGMAGYAVILRILLLIQGKELASYQGINGEGVKISLITRLKHLYWDFGAFTFKGQVLIGNIFATAALCLLVLAGIRVLITRAKKNPMSVLYFVLYLILIPLCANWILLVSPDVNYHLLMRYQWVLVPILFLTLCETAGAEGKKQAVLGWICFGASLVLILNYALTDQIAYGNLQKKYEKTYAYCLRLADRMEQTPGYYTGIPVAMVGVPSVNNFPLTDVTTDVTAPIIGMAGDYLVYTDTNYKAFFQNYLGITLNLVSDEEMTEIYYSDAYQSLDSFPGEHSMEVVNGILYIKTE